MKKKVLGICIGESSQTRITFISKLMPTSGEYVTLEYDGKKVLGMIESLTRGSPSISGDILDPTVVEKILRYESVDEHYVRGRVQLLCDVETQELLKSPPPPGTRINKADKQTLKKIFGEGHISIGNLISNPAVEVRVDLNKMITRHLAILAITGAGKSNTVSVIVEGILNLKGMPIIFDMHSEYVDAKFTGGVKRIDPSLNPLYLSRREFQVLLDVGKDAHVQARYLRKAYFEAQKKIRDGEKRDFIYHVLDSLREIQDTEENSTSGEKSALIGIINKVEDFNHKFRGLVNSSTNNIVDTLKQGSANVIDLGQVDEDYADVIVSHVLRKLLNKRKINEVPPAFCIVEEAHLLAPMYTSTLSKHWINRIAREGRKFGLGLCLVSQRPKNLDPNSLSQANNAIVMRLIEPSDQRHVQKTSERLSDDLLAQLPSLNIGEAVVLGLMTKIPALVKIRKMEGKLIGNDPNIVEEWQLKIKEKKKKTEEQHHEINALYEGMD